MEQILNLDLSKKAPKLGIAILIDGATLDNLSSTIEGVENYTDSNYFFFVVNDGLNPEITSYLEEKKIPYIDTPASYESYNRALWHFLEYPNALCDIQVYLQAGTIPNARAWEKRWVKFVQGHGAVNYLANNLGVEPFSSTFDFNCRFVLSEVATQVGCLNTRVFPSFLNRYDLELRTGQLLNSHGVWETPPVWLADPFRALKGPKVYPVLSYGLEVAPDISPMKFQQSSVEERNAWATNTNPEIHQIVSFSLAESFSASTPKPLPAFVQQTVPYTEAGILTEAPPLVDNFPFPKTLHLIALSGLDTTETDIKVEVQGTVESFLKFHSDWKVKVWRDGDLSTLNPALFNSQITPVQKAEEFKFHILNEHGGFYARHDVKFNWNLESLRFSLDNPPEIALFQQNLAITPSIMGGKANLEEWEFFLEGIKLWKEMFPNAPYEPIFGDVFFRNYCDADMGEDIQIFEITTTEIVSVDPWEHAKIVAEVKPVSDIPDAVGTWVGTPLKVLFDRVLAVSVHPMDGGYLDDLLGSIKYHGLLPERTDIVVFAYDPQPELYQLVLAHQDLHDIYVIPFRDNEATNHRVEEFFIHSPATFIEAKSIITIPVNSFVFPGGVDEEGVASKSPLELAFQTIEDHPENLVVPPFETDLANELFETVNMSEEEFKWLGRFPKSELKHSSWNFVGGSGRAWDKFEERLREFREEVLAFNALPPARRNGYTAQQLMLGTKGANPHLSSVFGVRSNLCTFEIPKSESYHSPPVAHLQGEPRVATMTFVEDEPSESWLGFYSEKSF